MEAQLKFMGAKAMNYCGFGVCRSRKRKTETQAEGKDMNMFVFIFIFYTTICIPVMTESYDTRDVSYSSFDMF